MSFAAIAVGGIGAAATVGGAAMQANAANKSPLTWSQSKISDQLGALLRQQIYGSYTSKGGLRYNTRPTTPFQGDFLGELMPQYGQALDLLGGYKPYQMSQWMDSSWKSAIAGTPSYQAKLDPGTTAKYFEQAVQNPMMHTFQTQVLPQINEGFAGVGAFSSRRGDAGQRALSDLQSNLTGQLGQFQLGNQQMQEQMNAQLAESAAQRSLSALSGYQQAQMNMANQPLMAAGAFNEVLRGLQGRIDSEKTMQYQDFLRTAPENSPYLQLMMQYLGMPQKNTVIPPNYVGEALKGGAGGIGLWQSLNQPQQQPQTNPYQNIGATNNIWDQKNPKF